MPKASVQITPSLFQEGEINIDCEDETPIKPFDDGFRIEVACTLVPSDEADFTIFELEWNQEVTGIWAFEESKEERIELEKGEGPSKETLVSPYDSELDGGLCVIPYEKREDQLERLEEQKACFDVDFEEVAATTVSNV